MQDFLHFTGRTVEWAAIMRVGLAAAVADGNNEAQAHVLRSLAGAIFVQRDFDRAMDLLQQVLGLGGAAEHPVSDAEQARPYAREHRHRVLEIVRHTVPRLIVSWLLPRPIVHPTREKSSTVDATVTLPTLKNLGSRRQYSPPSALNR
jgi:hypothetical protein